MANKNFIVKNGLEVGGQEVVSSSGVVTSAALGGQTLASTDSPTFANLTLTNDIAVGGDLNLTGDLNITGDVNSLSVTDLDVTDQTITLGAGQVESASGGSGVVVDGSGASILWDETNTEWDFNKDINVTGTVTSDGLTVDGNTKLNGSFTVNGNVDTSASLGEVLQLSQTDSVGGFLWSVDRATNTYKNMTYYANVHKFLLDTTTEAMRIDSSGNVGIGVTPRAKLDIFQQTNRTSKTGTTRGVLHLQDGDTPANNELTAITFESNSNNASAIIGQSLTNSGSELFFGTSNGYVSGVTNTAMTIKPSGYVGIGTGIPDYLLEAYNGDISSLKLTSAAGGNAVHALRFRVRNSGNTAQYATLGTVSAETVSGWGGALTFSTKPASGSPDESTTERMRVSSDGDIRINTIGQMGNATLTVKAYTNTNTGLMLQEYDTSNAYGLYTVTSDDSFRITRFVSGGYSDRLIIDSNGSFGINTSSLSTEASLFIGKQPSAGNQEGGQLVLQSSVNGSKAIHIDNYNNASTDFCRFMRGTDTTSEAVLGVWDITNTRFGIGTATPLQTLTVAGSAWATGYYITALQGNSQLTNASTSSGSNPSYIGQGLISVTVSDAKSKENFGSVEINECLDKIVSLSEHVKKFDWIDEDWKKEKGRTVGMVAQEIYEDHSEFVHKPENYDDDGWAIRYQEIVPTLIKAIQEQQTIIENLQSRLDEAGL